MPTRLSPNYRKQGLPPGTPRYTGTHQRKTTLRAHDIHDRSCTVHNELTVEQALELAGHASLTWIDVDGLSDDQRIVELCRGLKVHPLAIEDILQVGTRPKAELHDGHLLVVLKMIHLDANADGDLELEVEHIGVVLAEGVIVTFQERQDDPFDGLRRQLVEGVGPLRDSNAPRMLHALVDAVVDDAFDALEVLGQEVEALEASLLEDPPEDALEQIQDQRRHVLLIRRALRPLRETTFAIRRIETDLLPDRLDNYWTDVVDHLDQLLESLELYREMVMGMVGLHHTSTSNKLNDTMRVLTVISVLFLPLSFLAGLYGMNFSYMPELQVWWGYFALLGVMVVVAGGMAIWFKVRGWF